MVTVRGSSESVEARLRSGVLACWCGGTLRPWGHARPRRVATFAGLAEVVPRRGICRACGRTHVLLPAWLLSRRRYAAPVIFAALALRAAGLKVASVAARLRLPSPGRAGQCWSVPASTAGSWLSRFASRAGWLRQELLGLLPLVDPQGRPVAPAGWPRSAPCRPPASPAPGHHPHPHSRHRHAVPGHRHQGPHPQKDPPPREPGATPGPLSYPHTGSGAPKIIHRAVDNRRRSTRGFGSEVLAKDGYPRTLQARAICRNQGRDHGRVEHRKDQPTHV